MKDIYRAREKGKPVIEQPMAGKADVGARALLLRHRLSVVLFALLVLAFVGLLIGIIAYQQKQIVRQQQLAREAAPPPAAAPLEEMGAAI